MKRALMASWMARLGLAVALLLPLLGSLLPQLPLLTGRVAPEAEDSSRPGFGGRTEHVPVQTNPPASSRLWRLSCDARGRDA